LSAKESAVPAIELVVAGDPSTQTGGYVYDRQILLGLADLGWKTAVHSLDESFPRPTPAALRDARALLAGLPGGAVVVIDGLALAGLERVLETEARRLRVVALVHHPLALETGIEPASAKLLETAERNALALVRRVICPSQWTARALAAEYRVPAARIRVVEPGVDRRRAAAKGRSAGSPRESRESASGADALNLLCVGTLTPRKGHSLLFEALAELRDRRWHLTCAGSITHDVATVAALEKQLDRLALRSRVSLLGHLDPDALERHYERADLFVLPSYLEGYGMALAEAVARGIPVVSTTGGAIPEAVPAAASILVPPGDGRALLKALATLLDDAPARKKLAANARKARSTLPTWRGAAEKFADSITDL
jgi:glycosyltransferase involved in cell wall biosynthesis